MRTIPLVLLLAACAGDAPPVDSAGTTTGTGITTDGNADFVRACIAEQWLRSTCSGCHLEGSHLDLRFDALEELVESDRELHPGPILIPGDPDASLLVRKLEAKVGLLTLEEHEGDPMPIDTEITLEDAQLIRDWVAAGALVPSGC